MPRATSCGTLIISRTGRLLLCHVTGTRHWDIPKGMQEPGETTLDAAMREMEEETGLQFDASLFTELGRFTYRRDKDLFCAPVISRTAIPASRPRRWTLFDGPRATRSATCAGRAWLNLSWD
jgi:8-oxo-dGTP pyrophosphatase MutT (NUDIX family)